MMPQHLVPDLYVSYGVWDLGEEWGSDIQSSYVCSDVFVGCGLGMIVQSLWLLSHLLPASCCQTLLSTCQ